MLVGAGTVLTTDQVDRAVSAGAKFIVSPGLNPRIVQYCLDKNVPITPGTATPSDIERALELGLDVVKFFPAEVNGGIKAIKAMAAPYTQVKFMPTGGVNAKNLTISPLIRSLHVADLGWFPQSYCPPVTMMGYGN